MPKVASPARIHPTPHMEGAAPGSELNTKGQLLEFFSTWDTHPLLSSVTFSHLATPKFPAIRRFRPVPRTPRRRGLTVWAEVRCSVHIMAHDSYTTSAWCSPGLSTARLLSAIWGSVRTWAPSSRPVGRCTTPSNYRSTLGTIPGNHHKPQPEFILIDPLFISDPLHQYRAVSPPRPQGVQANLSHFGFRPRGDLGGARSCL